MRGLLITAAAVMRRMLTVPSALLALLAGALAGLLVLGMPDGELALEVFTGLLYVLATILVLPLVAGLVTADRQGGYEQLVAMRPVSSLSWTLGRILGAALGGATLVLLLGFTARTVGGSLQVPVLVYGESMTPAADGVAPTWRFGLQAGVRGPFELSVKTLSQRPGGGTLVVHVARGNAAIALPPARIVHRSSSLTLPDLYPARGDLHVTLRPDTGLLLGREPPQLKAGTEPLGRGGLPLPRRMLVRLGFAALATLVAACAFHFETACLSGLLALAVSLPAKPWIWGVTIGLLVLFGTLGTALTRRAALP